MSAGKICLPLQFADHGGAAIPVAAGKRGAVAGVATAVGIGIVVHHVAVVGLDGNQ